MHLRHALLVLALAATPAAAQQAPPRVFLETALQDTPRVIAIERSDAYYTRLKVHRMGSYAILPLFAAQYYLGNRLLNDELRPDWVKPAHQVVAASVGTVFAVNTVTGVWNLIEARNDPNNRTRRYLHAAAMLAADAGFAYTGLVASQEADDLGDGAHRHRNIALASVGVSTASVIMMWLLND